MRVPVHINRSNVAREIDLLNIGNWQIDSKAAKGRYLYSKWRYYPSNDQVLNKNLWVPRTIRFLWFRRMIF